MSSYCYSSEKVWYAEGYSSEKFGTSSYCYSSEKVWYAEGYSSEKSLVRRVTATPVKKSGTQRATPVKNFGTLSTATLVKKWYCYSSEKVWYAVIATPVKKWYAVIATPVK
jgi:hypothetical protein